MRCFGLTSFFYFDCNSGAEPGQRPGNQRCARRASRRSRASVMSGAICNAAS